MNVGCFIYGDSKKYDKLQKCAIHSFKKFHPNVPVFTYTSKDSYLKNEPMAAGFKKFVFAYKTAQKEKIDKIIILGADTITCSRLDEFLNINNVDVLTTLDYPYQLITNGMALSKSENDHINSDVVCFNNLEALSKTISLSQIIKTNYFEQGALNYICNIDQVYSNKIVDGDFDKSDVVYNARSKGNLCAKSGEKPWHEYTTRFIVKDNKLFTGEHRNIKKSKQIKVWHYCDGLGTLPPQEFESIINAWIEKGFNRETKDFFTNECDCGDFFKQKFTI